MILVGTAQRIRDWYCSARWRPPLVIGLLLLLVGIIGVGVAVRWKSIENDFYATASQVIATLFIAIILEAFSSEQALWVDDADRLLVLVLIGASLCGLFACLRGLLGDGGRIMNGITAAGIMAASTLVLLALLRRLQSVLPAPPATLLLIFAGPPVLVLIII
jgi:hypothetical protein